MLHSEVHIIRLIFIFTRVINVCTLKSQTPKMHLKKMSWDVVVLLTIAYHSPIPVSRNAHFFFNCFFWYLSPHLQVAYLYLNFLSFQFDVSIGFFVGINSLSALYFPSLPTFPPTTQVLMSFFITYLNLFHCWALR